MHSRGSHPNTSSEPSADCHTACLQSVNAWGNGRDLQVQPDRCDLIVMILDYGKVVSLTSPDKFLCCRCCINITCLKMFYLSSKTATIIVSCVIWVCMPLIKLSKCRRQWCNYQLYKHCAKRPKYCLVFTGIRSILNRI